MKEKINYDAEFCGRVPLHQTNLIQPHGILLIVDKNDLTVLQVSENAQELFDLPVREIVGRPLSDFLEADQLKKFRERFDQRRQGKLPFSFQLPGGHYLGIIQPAANYFILELERKPLRTNEEDSFIAIYQELKYVMAAIEDAGTTEETCAIAVAELKKISGFDKVMIYRFDEDWNGDVIAEVKEEGMDSYLGLKFPASDIPKQARDLYKRTAYRLIPDAAYEPVRLYPVLNPQTNAFTDLSDSNLRSVAAVHLEYLRNMKVMASMSTRIMVDGQLWGLIACHHRQPYFLSFEMCSVFELLSNVVSAKIAAVQKQDAFHYRNELQTIYTKLVEEIYREENLPHSLRQHHQELLKLLNAEGLAVIMNDHIDTWGRVPRDEEIREMTLWLQTRQQGQVYHQPSLVSEFEGAEKYSEIGSGILALPIRPDKGNFILAFRPEVIKKVNWGGNPAEAIQFEADRKNYHPRHSFGLWQQTVKQTAQSWRTEEIEIAEQFRNFIVGYTLNRIYS